MAEKYEINYDECSAKEGTHIIEIFDNLGQKLVNRFGGESNEDGEELKPRVSIKEGRRGCCGG